MRVIQVVKLVNAFSINMLSLTTPTTVVLRINEIDERKLCEEIRNTENAENYIGHKGTVDLINALCSTALTPNRKELKIDGTAELLVIQLLERLPEGKILTAEEVQQLMRSGRLKFLRVDVTVSPQV